MKKLLIMLVVCCSESDNKLNSTAPRTNALPQQPTESINSNCNTNAIAELNLDSLKLIDENILKIENYITSLNISMVKSDEDILNFLDSLSFRKLNELKVDNSLTKIVFENGYILYNSYNLITEYEFDLRIKGTESLLKAKRKCVYKTLALKDGNLHYLVSDESSQKSEINSYSCSESKSKL